METIDEEGKSRSASFLITLIFLIGMAVGLGILLGLVVHGADSAEGVSRKLLARLAWMSLAMLSLTMVMLFWLVAHYLTRRIRPHRHEPTQYVDAWSLAGQRTKPQVEEPEEEDEGESGMSNSQ